MLNNTKSYISFYVDFFDNNDIKNIEDKKYIESNKGLLNIL